jgi:hypothetical protein
MSWSEEFQVVPFGTKDYKYLEKALKKYASSFPDLPTKPEKLRIPTIEGMKLNPPKVLKAGAVLSLPSDARFFF